MGATKSTENIQIKHLTGNGAGHFWSYRKSNDLDVIKEMNFNDENAVVSSTEKLDWSSTFYEGVEDMNQKGDTLPGVDQKVNVNESDVDGLSLQFADPLLTDSGVDDIALWYSPLDFVQKMGAMLLIRRFVERSALDWSGGASNADDAYIYLGQTIKAIKSQIEPEVDLMVYNQTITQGEANTFWVRWKAEV